jgi:cellobiose-specific phosphotransferase system component IIC
MMEKMAPLFDQEHLASVRDGLAGLMPLLIVGAFSLALARCPSSGTGDVASTLAADLVAVVAQG